MDKKSLFDLISRYLLLLVIGLPNLYFFYFIFTPLTVQPTFFLLSLIDTSSYIVNGTNNVIFFKGYFASIIPACVAGAAYYLLLILNLSTPMNLKKRVHSVIFLLGVFLFFNLLRIFIFALLLSKGYQYFDLTHTATWYIGSTFLVIIIWFSSVHIFKIKEIPVYTDFKNIMSEIKNGS